MLKRLPSWRSGVYESKIADFPMDDTLGSECAHGSNSTEAVRRLLADAEASDAAASKAVADFFDRTDPFGTEDLEQISRSVTNLDQALGSIVSAPSERELFHRGCAGAALLSGADTVVLSRVHGTTAFVVCAGGEWPEVDSFAVKEGTAEADVLSSGGVRVTGDTRPASIAAVTTGGEWTVAAVPVDGRIVGFIHVSVVVPDVILDVFDGYAATLGGCLERSQLRSKNLLQEQVLRDNLQLLTDPASASIDMTTRSTHDTTGYKSAGAPAESEARQPVEPLTDRESEVLSAVLTGASNSVVADELVITVDTVKSHMKKILRKFGAANRAELIARHGPSEFSSRSEW